MAKTTRFLLDANFIMIPVQFKVDVYEELRKFGNPQIYTLDLVLKEVGEIRGAALALELFAKAGGNVIETRERPNDMERNEVTDDQIIKFSDGGNFVVCTQDTELQDRLKAKKIKVVFLRQKRFLEMG
jgi:rRNA-processing protein FCF1